MNGQVQHSSLQWLYLVGHCVALGLFGWALRTQIGLGSSWTHQHHCVMGLIPQTYKQPHDGPCPLSHTFPCLSLIAMQSSLQISIYSYPRPLARATSSRKYCSLKSTPHPHLLLTLLYPSPEYCSPPLVFYLCLGFIFFPS